MFDGLDPSVQPHLVPPAQLAVWAERVRPHLDKMGTGSSGRFTGSDILTAIASGRMQLWLALSGPDILCALVTEFQQYPRAKAIRLIGLVGNAPRRWRHLLPAVEYTAKVHFGCDLAEAFHLPRFGAILPGYRTTHWFAEKPL